MSLEQDSNSLLRKPSFLISIQLHISAHQEKIYNVFLKEVERIITKIEDDEININMFFEVGLAQVLKEAEIQETNYQKIKKMILELYSKTLKVNVLGKDKSIEIEEYAHLLDNLRFTKQRGKEIIIRYSIPNMVFLSMLKINHKLKNHNVEEDIYKGIYANINMKIVNNLQSKYAIKLYELMEDYKKTEIPKMTMEKFRTEFGIEKKYTIISDLRKRVLEPATSEINKNDRIDMTISYELIKTGRKYTHIKFHIKPKPVKMKLEQQKTELLQQEAQENPDLQELILILPSELRNTRVAQTILGALEQKSKEYIQKQIEYCLQVNKKKKINYFAGYLKKAIEQDYAGAEVLEITKPKKEENLSDYIDTWLIINNIGYCITEIKKEDNKIAVVAEEKGTGAKKIIKFPNLETLKSYI